MTETIIGRRIIAIVAVVTLLLASGLAVPVFNVSVQGLGEGHAPVCSPQLYGGFYFKVDSTGTITGLQVIFPKELPAGSTIYARINSTTGTVATGSLTLNSDLPPNTGITVSVSPGVEYSSVDTVVVSITGNETNSTEVITLRAEGVGTSSWDESRTVYAQPINVTYNGTQVLENWPVKVVLRDNGLGDYYINWTAIENNPNSIRFVDSSGRLLNYWIEILDPTDMYAVIWVNVTVPPGGTRIWMLYGDSVDYSSYNDGHKVFPFFDDFEVWSGWIQYRRGIVQQTSDNFEYGGSYAAEKTGYTDPNGAYKSLGRVFYSNNTYGGLIVEYWDKRITPYTRGPFDRVGLIDDGGNGYGAVFIVRYDQIRIDVRVAYRGYTKSTETVSAGLNALTWYFVRFEIINNANSIDLVMKLYDYYGNLVDSTSYTDTTYLYNAFTNVYIFGGYTYHIDALRVRYYTPNEPQAVVDEWYRYLSFEPTCS